MRINIHLSPTFKQTVFSFGVLFNMMALGMTYGYPAILTPQLLSPSSDIVTTASQTSWIASISGFSGLLPVLAIGPLMHVYGRRFTHLCVIIPTLLGWILTSVSFSLPVLIFARFLHCVNAGAIYFWAVCIAEFSSPRNRCTLMSFKVTVTAIGILIIHVFGYFMHWRQLALVAVTPTALSLIITYFWPDTPDWLVSKGRFEEAESVFYGLRGKNEESEKELRKLIEEKKTNDELANNYTMITLIKQLRSKSLWRPVALYCCAMNLPEFGGRHYFPAYSVELAAQITGDDSKSFFYTYVIDVISVIGSFCSVYLVNRWKRRQLILLSGYLSVFILVVSSALMYVRMNYNDNKVLLWINLSLIALYFFIAFSTTFPVSYIILGELLPLEYRSVGALLNGILSSLTVAGTTKLVPILKNSFGIYGMFLVFSICMLITLFYMQYDLPETQRRTLQDIGDYFKGKSSKYRLDNSVHQTELK